MLVVKHTNKQQKARSHVQQFLQREGSFELLRNPIFRVYDVVNRRKTELILSSVSPALFLQHISFHYVCHDKIVNLLYLFTHNYPSEKAFHYIMCVKPQ